MITYLVDAFNVLHAEPRLERLLRRDGPGPACQALVQLFCAWLSLPRRKKVAAVLVVDGRRPLEAGRPGPGPVPGLTVLYMQDEADAELKRRLRLGSGGRRVLVSADREIVAVADATGHEALAPRAFLRDVQDDLDHARDQHERERTLPPREVQAWLRAFGGEPREPAPPGGAPAAPGASNAGAPAAPGASDPGAPAAPGARNVRAQPAAPSSPPRPPTAKPTVPPPPARRDQGPLSDAEVRAWKAFFDGPPEPP